MNKQNTLGRGFKSRWMAAQKLIRQSVEQLAPKD